MKLKLTCAVMLVSCLSAAPAIAADPIFSGTSMTAKSSAKMKNMTLTVTGPDGYHAQTFSASQSPFLSLEKSGNLADGLYKWQLTGASSETVLANPGGLDYGRGSGARKFANKPMIESGSFRVIGGTIAGPSKVQESPNVANDSFNSNDRGSRIELEEIR